jgi:carbonic anhydrase
MSFSPDSLKDVRISELSEGQMELLEKAVDMLGLERTLEGSETLAFLAGAYRTEKNRGSSANTEALKIIEAMGMVTKVEDGNFKKGKEKTNEKTNEKTQANKIPKVFTNKNSIAHDGVNEMEIQKAYSKLVEGNKRFMDGKITLPDYAAERIANVKGQKPYAGILYCSDSRVNVEEIFDALGGGKIFSSSVAGNLVDRGFLGSMEYAAEHLGTKLFVVLGHTMCGAVNAACGSDHAHGNLDYILKELQPAVKAGNKDLTASIVENVKIQIENTRKGSQLLAEMEEKGEIKILGAVYDIASGKVNFLE